MEAASFSDLSFGHVSKNSEFQKFEDGYTLSELPALNKESIDREFRALAQITTTKEHFDRLWGTAPEFREFNRYSDIMPYRHSMVELPDNKEDFLPDVVARTYINANFMPDLTTKDNKALILTQGPLPNTVFHLWKMIWSYDVPAVFMMCNVTEKNMAKCAKYWPDTSKTMVVGNLTVTNKGEKMEVAGVMVREFELSLKTSDVKKKVMQYHFQAWPDHGSPSESECETIDNLVSHMDEHRTTTPEKPIVIHCSAGIGRSGSLVSLYHIAKTVAAMRKAGKAEMRISIFSMVRKIREYRMGSVQSGSQYQFLFHYAKHLLKKI